MLGRMLQEIYDVTCFSRAQNFLDVAAALAPGCLVLDLHMPEISGADVQRTLADRNLRFPTIMITGQADVTTAVQTMRAGAFDFVEKPFTRETILQSLRLAQHRLAPTITANEHAVLAKAHLATLSAREVQVLDGLIAGLPNKTIAYDLGLSPRTVEMHRAHVMKKMEAGSLSALVRAALAAGIQGSS